MRNKPCKNCSCTPKENSTCPTCDFIRNEYMFADNDSLTRDALVLKISALRNEVARLLDLLGRKEPVRCLSCREIRELSEKTCGNCGESLLQEFCK
jgi:hypothetical protein